MGGTHWRQPKKAKGVRGTCVTGKVRFGTMAAARKAVEAARHSRDMKRAEERAYFCPRCAGFHLSSKPKGWTDTRALSCPSQSEDGYPCSLAKGHPPNHVWESPCPDEMPNREWWFG